jgi:hypothetical protein
MPGCAAHSLYILYNLLTFVQFQSLHLALLHHLKHSLHLWGTLAMRKYVSHESVSRARLCPFLALDELNTTPGGAAAVSCLNLGNYMSQYHICSVQAVYILHAYEHLVGSTNQWVGLKSVALTIAKGLGLHK